MLGALMHFFVIIVHRHRLCESIIEVIGTSHMPSWVAAHEADHSQERDICISYQRMKATSIIAQHCLESKATIAVALTVVVSLGESGEAANTVGTEVLNLGSGERGSGGGRGRGEAAIIEVSAYVRLYLQVESTLLILSFRPAGNAITSPKPEIAIVDPADDEKRYLLEIPNRVQTADVQTDLPPTSAPKLPPRLRD